MMESCKDSPVPAIFSLEPFGHAGNRRGTESSFFLDGGVWCTFREHAGSTEALSKFFYLTLGHKVAEKSSSFGSVLEREYRPDE